MARQGRQLQVVEILPPEVKRDVRELLPAQRFKELKWFQKLSEKEQDIVKHESQQLAGMMLLNGISRLAIGAHLLALHQTLEPKRAWLKFLKTFTKYTHKQAYRYIDGYVTARDTIPQRFGISSARWEHILKAAEIRGMDMIGIKDAKKFPLGAYTEAFRRLGPPSNSADPNKYLDDLEEMRVKLVKKLRKQMKSTHPDEQVVHLKKDEQQDLLRECYRAVTRRLKNVPGKQAAELADELFGMVIQKLGISSLHVKAQAAPEDYDPKPVGRPKEEGEAVAS